MAGEETSQETPTTPPAEEPGAVTTTEHDLNASGSEPAQIEVISEGDAPRITAETTMDGPEHPGDKAEAAEDVAKDGEDSDASEEGKSQKAEKADTSETEDDGDKAEAADKDAAETDEPPENVPYKRLAKEVRRTARAKSEADDLKAQLAEEKQKREAAELQLRNSHIDPDDYEDFDEYLGALKEADGGDETPAPKPKAEKEAPAPDETAAQRQAVEDSARAEGVEPSELWGALSEIEAVCDERDPELWNKVAALPSMSATIAVGLAELDNAADILEALVADPDRATEISKMRPLQQARALAAIETKKAKDTPLPKPKRETADDPPGEVAPDQGSVVPAGEDDVTTYMNRMNEEEFKGASRHRI